MHSRTTLAQTSGKTRTTEGKWAPADQEKKLRRGCLVFRKEGRKGFIERLALLSDVKKSRYRQKTIFKKSGSKAIKKGKKGGATPFPQLVHTYNGIIHMNLTESIESVLFVRFGPFIEVRSAELRREWWPKKAPAWQPDGPLVGVHVGQRTLHATESTYNGRW